MGSYTNFKNYDDTAQTDGSYWAQPTSSTPLVRQSSIYSLTFDEFQNTLGGSVKEFGSMNMEEFLKNIWTAEENQSLSTSILRQDGNAFNGNLRRQCSLTLPRTLSQKTVEQVWRDVLKDQTTGGQDANTSSIVNLLPREPTLGDMTLEDFLAKAGVVREEIQMSEGTARNSVPLQNDGSAYVTLDFRQPSRNDVSLGHEPSHHDNAFLASSNFGVIPGGVCFTGAISQQPILPKQTTLSFSSPPLLGNNGLFSGARTKGSDFGTSHSLSNTSLQGEQIGVGVGNHFHRDVKNNLDSPPLSPSPSSSPLPNAFGGVGARGRRSTASMEKAVERRRKRMIKNRESAARSRARKQAYTLELEAEIASLKDKNHELREKQKEILEMQKNQMLEAMKVPRGSKRRCLRRTSTGSW